MMSRFKLIIYIFIAYAFFNPIKASYVLIPMDNTQTNHLKAYGIAYNFLEQKIDVDWLLNYRGGSFMIKNHPNVVKECIVRNVAFKIIADIQSTEILSSISKPEINQDIIRLKKAPKVAIYSPSNKQPWDDAVTMALSYAEIPYDVIYDKEVLSGILPLYDWLHLHHEDFTGQYGKFYAMYKNASWYQEQKKIAEKQAKELGFSKVSKQKLAVAKKIKEFILSGGFLFAMCSATDSYDIALAAENHDICENVFDGDNSDENIKLNFHNTLAFTNFEIIKNPNKYEFSNIDATETRKVKKELDFFTLFEFSAKWDPVPTMLCQNHTKIIKGFMGQTTAFRKK